MNYIPWTIFGVPTILLLQALAAFILVNGVLQNLIHVFQLVLAWRTLRRQRRADPTTPLAAWWQLSRNTLPVSILVPAFNEEKTVVDNVRSLLALRYPNFEIIVINDGSNDGTLQRLTTNFGLEPVNRLHEPALPHQAIRGVYGSVRFPHLTVIDKENGGKADALNAGINLARYPLFCAIDADSMLESDALLRAVQPFVESPERVVGVGGTVRIANGNRIVGGRVVEAALPRSPLVLVQIVEYLRAFLMARVALSEVEALMLISGAFGIFRRAVVIQAGGYSRDTVGEDLEIVVKLHRYLLDQKIPLEIRFVPEPVCWTQAPTTLGGLMRQRTRWQRGALETYFRHIGMFLRPRYGRAGSLGMSSVLLLDVMGPLIEVLGYLCVPLFWYLGMLNVPYLIAYLALTFGMGIFISVGSLVLEEMEMQRFKSARDLMVLTLAAIFENFGYRQIHNVWRFIGWIQFLLGRTHWGTPKRETFDGSDSGGSPGGRRTSARDAATRAAAIEPPLSAATAAPGAAAAAPRRSVP